MANLQQTLDPGATLRAENGFVPELLTAGGTVAITGIIVDRFSAGDSLRYGLSVLINFIANIANGETLTVTATLQDGDNAALSDAATFGSTFATAEMTGITASALVHRGILKGDFNLKGAKRYIRVNIAAVFSAADTDNFDSSGTLALMGGQEEPASQPAVGVATT